MHLQRALSLTLWRAWVDCAIATDAYLKGSKKPFSVEDSEPQELSALEEYFGGTFKHNLSIDKVKGLLGKDGDMGVVFGNRGAGKVGHVFNAINMEGKVYFVDGQSGQLAEIEEEGYKNFSLLKTK